MDCQNTAATHQEMWYDADKDQHFLLRDGQVIPCNAMGNPVRKFVHYASGHFDYRARMQYSTTTHTSHMVPNRPLSLTDVQVRSLYCPQQEKFNGYMQFPRPLSEVFCNASREERFLRLAKLHRGLKHVKLRSPANVSNLTTYKDPNATCTFLGSTRKSAVSPHSVTRGSFFPASRRDLSLPQSVDSRPISCLPPRPLMFNSTLKSDYIPSLRGTFSTFHNLKNVSESTRHYISNEGAINAGTALRTSSTKNYVELKDELRREEREIKGYQAPPVKEKRIPIKGIYRMHVPTEGELYNSSVQRRNVVNPAAAAEEARRDRLDRALLTKRRNQRILKNKAMETSVKVQEKALLREIKDKQHMLAQTVPVPIPSH